MTWRTGVLIVAWLSAAFWGIFYLVVLASSSLAFIAYALLHFAIGYAWGRAVMARPLTQLVAVPGLVAAGAFTRLAIGSGTNELYFAPVGILAAIALADTSTVRTVLLSVLSFALGALAFLWLGP